VKLQSTNDLLDDLAYQVHDYLLEESVDFDGNQLAFVPITELVKKFQKNHRTIARRITALSNAKLVGALIRKTSGTLYWIKEEEDEA
jgi:hypothetical protein